MLSLRLCRSSETDGAAIGFRESPFLGRAKDVWQKKWRLHGAFLLVGRLWSMRRIDRAHIAASTAPGDRSGSVDSVVMA